MIVRNTIFEWIGVLLTMLIGLVIAPLIINSLGAAGYGAWAFLVSLSVFLFILDFGIATAINTRMARHVAEEDLAGAGRFSKEALSIYSIMGLLAYCVYLAIAYVSPWLFELPAEILPVFQRALIIYGLGQVLQFPARVFESRILANEMYHLASIIYSAAQILKFILILTILPLEPDLVTLAVIFTLVEFTNQAVIALVACKKFPFPDSIGMRWDWVVMKQMLAYGSGVLMNSLGDKVRNQLPLLFLASFHGPVNVSQFAIGFRLIQYKNATILKASSVIHARFVALFTTGKLGQLQDLYFKTTFYITLISSFISIMLLFLAESFIVLWVGDQFRISAHIVYILLPALFVTAPFSVVNTLLFAISKHRYAGIMGLVEAVLVLLACLTLIPLYGVFGAAISFALPMSLIRPFFVPRYCCKQLDYSLAGLWTKSILRAWLSFLAAAVLYAPLAYSVTIRTWLELILMGAVLAGIFMGCAFWLSFNKEERAYWYDKLKRAAQKK